MSFYRETQVKSVRKARQCLGCQRRIEVGQPALNCSGNWDGDFWAGTYHTDCRDAEVAHNKECGSFGNEWQALHEIEWDAWPWLIEAFPTVAARMNATTERYNKIQEEQRRCREAFAARMNATTERYNKIQEEQRRCREAFAAARKEPHP
jgi:hypothetical protein